MKLFRVIMPVSDIERAAVFYTAVLGLQGERVSPGRHYFDCGGTILACFDSELEDSIPSAPNPQFIYLAVKDLEGVLQRALQSGCVLSRGGISTQPWGERMFWTHDPFGNPISFVDEATLLTSLAKAPLNYDPATGKSN